MSLRKASLLMVRCGRHSWRPYGDFSKLSHENRGGPRTTHTLNCALGIYGLLHVGAVRWAARPALPVPALLTDRDLRVLRAGEVFAVDEAVAVVVNAIGTGDIVTFAKGNILRFSAREVFAVKVTVPIIVDTV